MRGNCGLHTRPLTGHILKGSFSRGAVFPPKSTLQQIRDQAIETVPTRYAWQDIYEAGCRGGGEAYLKLKRYEQVVFYRFSKSGYALYKAGRSDKISWKIMSRTMYVWFQLLRT